MRLLESTSKALLGRYGLAAPSGKLCSDAAQVRAAAELVGTPLYVKAQIAFGDRAGLGMVLRADDADEASDYSAALLGRVVEGTVVESVLLERAVEADMQVYLSVHVDDEASARILRVGSAGGTGYRPATAELAVPIGVHGIELFELRKLLRRFSFESQPREVIARAAHALTRAAREWHAYTIEVNPLFVTADQAIAVDAKIELDDYSLKHVPDRTLLPEQLESPRERAARQFQERDYRGSLRYVQLLDDAEALDGRIIGSHSVGGGESLVVFDALEAAGLRAANYCDTSGAPSEEKVAFAAELIASQPHIAGYFFSSCIANQPLSVTAAGLVAGLDAAGWRGPTVVRIAGNEEQEARAIVTTWADRNNVSAAVLGREIDEWGAAERLATILSEGNERSGIPRR